MHSPLMLFSVLTDVLNLDTYKGVLNALLGKKQMLGIQYDPERHGKLLIREEVVDEFFKDRLELLSLLTYLYHLDLVEVKMADEGKITHIILDSSLSDYVKLQGSKEGRQDLFVPGELKPLAMNEHHFFKVLNDAVMFSGMSIYAKVKNTFHIAMAASESNAKCIKDAGNIALGYYDADGESHLIQGDKVYPEGVGYYLGNTSFSQGSGRETLSGNPLKTSEDMPHSFSGDYRRDIEALNLTDTSAERMMDVCAITAALLSVTFEDAAAHLFKQIPGAPDFQDALGKVQQGQK